MSLNLSATTHILEVTTTGTGQVQVEVSFTDDLAGVRTGGSQTTNITTATTTTVCAAPAASTVRFIDEMTVMAVASNVVTVQKDISATETIMIGPMTLTAGQRAQFVSARGWRVFNADGSEKTGATSTIVPDGSYGDITVVGSGTDWIINAGVVSNAALATAAANTIKANNTAGVASPTDVTIATDSIVARFGGNLGSQSAAAQSAFIKSSGNLFNVTFAAGQFLGRTAAGGDLGAISLPAASDTASGVIEIAVQSEQATGTDVVRAVSPGRQHFHPSAAKCWGFTTGGATEVLNAASYNMTSITDGGVGLLTVTMNVDFSSANYVCQVTGGISAGNNRMMGQLTKAAGSVLTHSSSAAATLADMGTGRDWVMFGTLV